MDEHARQNHTCKCAASGVTQTLDEMEWQRGIWYAALMGDKGRVTELLQKDGAAKATDNAGYTALHYAARSGHVGICESLLDHGADINAQTNSGKATPLQRAAAAGQLETVKFLLRRGACPDILDVDGQTALHRAADFNHPDVMTVLTETSTALKVVKDNKGRTAYDLLSSTHAAIS